MNASAPADPVRLEVEEALHRVVDGLTAIPCAAVRRVTQAVAKPVGLVRSMVELTLHGVLGGGAAAPASSTVKPAESPQPAPVDESSDTATAVVVDGDPDDASTELPLHGYESLAASQVVARLSRLEPDELELIKAFELAHRGRRTILGKIDQLLAGP